jgi:hypothetical protein
MNGKGILCLLLTLVSLQCRATTNTTLVVGGSTSSATLTVNSGQVARVVSLNLAGNSSLNVAINGTSFLYSFNSSTANIYPPLPLVVAGPASFVLNQDSGGGQGFCTIELCDTGGSFLPSNAVVIPADSGGQVNIILESSADLVNWTAALPGLYGTSTTNRFFRVRAQRTP